MKQQERIQTMESALEEVTEKISALSTAFKEYAVIREKIRMLEEYYTGGLWIKDYEDDEAGKLPEDLKRGVLSQDAVNDMLEEDQELRELILQELMEEPVSETEEQK